MTARDDAPRKRLPPCRNCELEISCPDHFDWTDAKGGDAHDTLVRGSNIVSGGPTPPDAQPDACPHGELGGGICLPCTEPDAGEEIVHSALQAALDFFESRDEMNAFVHQGAVRWSPITEKVREAVAIIRRKP